MGILFIIFNIVIHSYWRYAFNLAAAPVINNLPNATTILEDTSTAVRLYILDVTDADGDAITCSFGAGTTPGTGQTRFSLRYESTTWAIYTVAGGVYDYNSQPTYSLEIDCEANGDKDTSTYAVQLAENQVPVIQNVPDSVNVSTLTAAIGDNVFTVIADDTENDQITFSISCSPATPTCPFEIFDSGAIQLNADISNFNIPGYDVTVSVSDSRGSGIDEILTILFTDINSPPQIQNLGSTINVPENTVLGSTIVTTLCTDSDATDTLIYLMSCTSSGSTYFQINSASGVISASPTSLINYEHILSGGSTSFTCTVTCNDGRASVTATVGFDVTNVNEAPAFSQNAYSISADEGAAGTVIQTTGYEVTDEDASDTKAFTMDCGTATGFFSIDTSTGLLSYASDYDIDDGVRPSNASCVVTVTDSGGLSDTATLSITINNLNDNAPAFSYSSYVWFVSEVDPVGTTVGTVNVTDGDIGTYGDLAYSLDQSSLTTEYFEIDTSGVVKIKNSISALGPGVVPTFYVIATDGGGNATRATATVIIAATTTPTTTSTTDRYKTFFDDGRNIAWFTACCIVLVVTAIVIGIMCFSYTGKSSPDFRFRCCRLWEEPARELPRNWGEDHRYDYKRRRPPRVTRPRRDPARFDFWSESYRQMD
ncbi:protocadherin Fat 3-like [Mercenaria mercenaria]|uniref:protocadherin Fat 3-like n=1 Tax=Mercenaria mercenaria TaxID=6596 RepID=UPI00234F3AD4|nr:protocadherin Fat 3-like [Mercenaria mercenaria]